MVQSHQQTRLDIVLGHVLGYTYTRERERMDRVENLLAIAREQIKQAEREEKAQAFQEWARSVKWQPATKRTRLVGLA
jgi:hypothetical protein